MSALAWIGEVILLVAAMYVGMELEARTKIAPADVLKRLKAETSMEIAAAIRHLEDAAAKLKARLNK